MNPIQTLEDCGAGLSSGCLFGLLLDAAVVVGLAVVWWVL